METNSYWIDKTSEEYLVTLVDALARARVVLVSTYRSEYRPPWIDRSYATQVSLPPLLPPDSLTMARSLPGAAEVADVVLESLLTS